MEEKLPEEELKQRLNNAAKQVTVGATYRHYKNQLYTILNLAILEATNEICVVYKAQYGKQLVFIRPVTEWVEEVSWEGENMKRFKKIN